MTAAASNRWKIAVVGYGEVGRIIAEDLRREGMAVSACDIKLSGTTPMATEMRAHAASHGVLLDADHAKAVAGADIVFCAVTASQTLAAAQGTAKGIKPGAWFLDFNSASPAAKLSAASAIKQAGGTYVEGAVMTSFPPYRIRVPLLLGGPDAATLAPLLNAIGFDAKLASEKLGIASATKMCRSVMVKGMEAMVIESLTAARFYGVEDRVLASMAETFPGIDWEKQATYFFQRVIQHGRRRAEEMREVARTVSEAGLDPWSASGSAERDAWTADLADAGVFGAKGAKVSDWREAADYILASRSPRKAGA